jgi:voltage-gated potassium channel
MRNSSFRRIVTGIIFFSLTVVGAVIGYMVAGWNFLDAIYMVVITIFGVGYGEVQPLTSPPLKVFTIFVIIAGALSVAYIVSGFVQMITEGEIHRALNVKRMTKEISSLEDHVIICGFGRIGQLVARKLKRDRQPFIIVDNDPERVVLAKEQGYLIYQGNATDETALEAAGILRAKSLATVLPNDAANVFITLTAREMNSALMILARGEMPSTEKKLRLAGANHVVLPASISALRIAHLISHPSAVDFLSQTDGQHGLNEFLAELDIQLNGAGD